MEQRNRYIINEQKLAQRIEVFVESNLGILPLSAYASFFNIKHSTFLVYLDHHTEFQQIIFEYQNAHLLKEKKLFETKRDAFLKEIEDSFFNDLNRSKAKFAVYRERWKQVQKDFNTWSLAAIYEKRRNRIEQRKVDIIQTKKQLDEYNPSFNTHIDETVYN